LLSNAIKFADRGEIGLAVTQVNDSQPSVGVDSPSLLSCFLRFSVRDAGIGIPTEIQARLFQPFIQADGSTTRKYGGTGLGLAIAKQLVQMMDGEIGVESTPGVGSTFWFTVRLEQRPTAVGSLTLQLPAIPSRTNGTIPFLAQVLLAEDNPVNQELTKEMLENCGCQVDVVATGYEVLAVLERTLYDVIFMDCQMPDLDGFAATKAIRERESRVPSLSKHSPHLLISPASPHIPIIALTANALEEVREQCLAAGMDDYLSKPFNHEQLRVMLLRWLTVSEAKRQTREGNHKPTNGIVFSNGDMKPPTVAFERQDTAPSMSASLDSQALANIRALQRPGAPDLLVKIIESYLSFAPQLLQTLRDAITHQEASTIQQAAHSLRSSSLNLGAITVATLSKDLEAMGQKNILDNAAQIFTEIEVAYEATRVALLEEQKKRLQ
jgi:CheY-like chemotaxis protein